MGVSFAFKPPALNAGLAVHAAKTAAETAGAEVLLAASLPLVPRDTGDLAASGHVEHDETGAAVVYDVTSPEGYPYGIRQHEDLALHHPNGGQAKFLEQPMHTAAPAVAATVAATLRKALGG